MNVFDIRNNVVDHYAEYMKSFVRISDSEIKGYVEDHLTRGRLGRRRWVVERTLAWLAQFRRLTYRRG